MWSEIDRFIAAAEMHGLKSSPDHEVGDLQDMLRTAWEMLSPTARKVFTRSMQMCWIGSMRMRRTAMGKTIIRIVRPGEVCVDDDDHWEDACDLVALEVDGDDDHVFTVVGRLHFDTVAAASMYLASLLRGAKCQP